MNELSTEDYKIITSALSLFADTEKEAASRARDEKERRIRAHRIDSAYRLVGVFSGRN